MLTVHTEISHTHLSWFSGHLYLQQVIGPVLATQAIVIVAKMVPTTLCLLL